MGWTGEPPPFFPSADHTAQQRSQLNAIIKDKLFLTNFRGAESLEDLRRVGCTHIVAVGAEFVNNESNHAASSLKVKFWNKDVTDDEEQGALLGQSLRDAAGFIRKALKKKKGVCVVHCAAGISRSATVVLGYLMLHRGQSLRDAFALLHSSRSCIWPNEGFMQALIALEMEVRGKATITLEEYERWGDYEGPENPTVEESTRRYRTKDVRQAAAAAATDEAVLARDDVRAAMGEATLRRHRLEVFAPLVRLARMGWGGATRRVAPDPSLRPRRTERVSIATRGSIARGSIARISAMFFG